MRLQSLPSRERGLKFDELCLQYELDDVAPLAGAWIEIMDAIDQRHQLGKSLPSRERGLKSCDKFCVAVIPAVAPLAGAWIEIDGKCRRNTAVGSLPSRERGLK